MRSSLNLDIRSLQSVSVRRRRAARGSNHQQAAATLVTEQTENLTRAAAAAATTAGGVDREEGWPIGHVPPRDSKTSRLLALAVRLN